MQVDPEKKLLSQDHNTSKNCKNPTPLSFALETVIGRGYLPLLGHFLELISKAQARLPPFSSVRPGQERHLSLETVGGNEADWNETRAFTSPKLLWHLEKPTNQRVILKYVLPKPGGTPL